MANLKMRRTLVVCLAAATVLLIVPATSQGCEFLDRLMPWNWCSGSNAAATYAPAYAAQYPVATQTCCYVPQTSYRTVMRTVPATVYRPTTCCDPCTGCATTCYSPVTSYVRSAQLVPYTTYTPVWTTTCSPCGPTCDPCGSACNTCTSCTTTVTNGCSSCATPAVSTPSSTLVPTPMQESNQPSNSGTQQPTLPKSSPAQPYKQNKPIPPVPQDEIRESSMGAPQLNGPSFDRVTARPVRQATYQTVSYKDTDITPRADYGGWRASDK